MGIIHYIGRPDNRTLFKLGKFWWQPEVFLGDGVRDLQSYQLSLVHHALLDETTLRERILSGCVTEKNWSVDPALYAAELARRLTAFADGHEVVFLNDASSDLWDEDEYGDGEQSNVVDTCYSADWGWPQAAR